MQKKNPPQRLLDKKKNLCISEPRAIRGAIKKLCSHAGRELPSPLKKSTMPF